MRCLRRALRRRRRDAGFHANFSAGVTYGQASRDLKYIIDVTIC